MRNVFLVFVIGLLVYQEVAAQACFRIESILVDACGSPEGPNEMVRLRIGPNPLNTSDMQVTWPNNFNPYLGVCQSPQTASKVAAMNNQIQACGYFVEPTNGVLPANSTVLFITSTNFDQNAHNYAGLSDTLYVIFQCAGNTTGHFANWVDGCNPATGNRTTTISFGGNCTQLVTYNRCSLTNQNGGIGGTSAERDGARVDFAPNGVASYANEGCTIPYTPLTISTGFVNGQTSFCANETIAIQAVINGNWENANWSSSDGTFSDPNSLLSFFTPNANSSGTVSIQFSAENGCGNSVSSNLTADILPEPEIEIISQINQIGCDEIASLQATGADNYTWSNGETSSTISVLQSGIYTVSGSNNCGTAEAEATINLSSNELMFETSNDTTICPNTVVYIEAFGEYNYEWLTLSPIYYQSENMIAIEVEFAQQIHVIATDTNGCQGERTITLSTHELPELVVSGNAFGFMGDEFELWADAGTEGNYSWSPGEYLSCINCQNPNTQPDQSMIYTVSFVDTNGCSTQAQLSIRLESTLYIPNAFSPNDDGVNDEFRVGGADLDEFQLDIFNRWGELIITLSSYADSWDGTYKNRLSPEGVYPWILRFRDNDGLQYEKTGHVSLIRRGE